MLLWATLLGLFLFAELPTPWAVSGAERFARGGVELLRKTGLVTHLAFGSECGDLEALQRVEACLSGESFQEALRRRLEGGETFARCRQAAVEELLDPRDAALLSQPNNILAIEYLKALRWADFSMEPITFPRRGGPHDGGAADGIASASHIRGLLRAGHTEEAMAFLPRESAEVLRREIAAGRGPVDMHTCQRAILARLRTMSQEDFLPYDGGGEGLYRRFYRAVRQAADIDGLLEAAGPGGIPWPGCGGCCWRRIWSCRSRSTSPICGCWPPAPGAAPCCGRCAGCRC